MTENKKLEVMLAIMAATSAIMIDKSRLKHIYIRKWKCRQARAVIWCADFYSEFRKIDRLQKTKWKWNCHMFSFFLANLAHGLKICVPSALSAQVSFSLSNNPLIQFFAISHCKVPWLCVISAVLVCGVLGFTETCLCTLFWQRPWSQRLSR